MRQRFLANLLIEISIARRARDKRERVNTVKNQKRNRSSYLAGATMSRYLRPMAAICVTVSVLANHREISIDTGV